jgi:hypothetical protein
MAAALLLRFAQLALGIGLLGAVAARLPVRLDTFVNRALSDLIPPLLLLGLWVIDSYRVRLTWFFALAGVVAFGALGGVVTGSKGGLVKVVVAVGLLWSAAGRWTVLRIGLVLGAGAVSLLMYQFAAQVRYARVAEGLSLVDALGWAAAAVSTDGMRETSRIAASHLLLRVTGADGVWLSLDSAPSAIDWSQASGLLWTSTLPVYYTRDVVGIMTEGDLRGPGMVGAFMVMGGSQGVTLFTALLVVGASLAWRALAQLRAGAVACAAGASFLLGWAGDGGFALTDVIALSLAIAFTEAVYRRVLAGPDAVPGARSERPETSEDAHAAPPAVDERLLPRPAVAQAAPRPSARS